MNTRFPVFTQESVPLKEEEYELELPNDNEVYAFTGYLLGEDTSHRPDHVGHSDSEFSPKSARCSACRWFEVKLFRTKSDYVVWTAGRTIVPGESDRIRVVETVSGFAVIESLTVRGPAATFIPNPSMRVIAKAAAFDEGIYEAYNTRSDKLS